MKRVSPRLFWVGITLMVVGSGFISYIVTNSNIARVITFLFLTVPAFVLSWKNRNAGK